jgi:hypothetical protein
MDFSLLELSLKLSAAGLLIKPVVTLVTLCFVKLPLKEKWNKIQWRKLYGKGDVITFICMTILFYLGFSLFEYVGISTNYWVNIGICVMFGALFTSYSFLLQPIFLLFDKKNYSKSDIKTSLITDKNINLRIIESDILNAFATGVLPFTKTILLGRPLFEKFSVEEIDAFIAHELGHINKNHLWKLYLCNVLYLFFYITFNQKILSYFIGSDYYVVVLAINAGLFMGAGNMFVLGQVQKIFEKQADLHGASLVGKESYKNMLIKLNELSKGALEKWAFNYPKLSERLDNLDKTFVGS